MYYHHWIVRYVPDPVRGEFVNIALLVGKDGADWAFRAVSNLRRATRLGGDPTAASYWLRELERMVTRLNDSPAAKPEPALAALADSGEHISAAIVARLAGRLNNAVQISAPHPVIADSAQIGLEMLFDHLVADPKVRQRTQFSTRVNHFVLRQFQQAGIEATVQPRPQILVGNVPRTASFAVTDAQVEQITNAWSFNLQDMDNVSTQVQAWAGHMHRLQKHGGIMEVRGRPPLTVPRGVQLRVVYEEPMSEAGKDALQIAQEIWSDIDGFVAYPESRQIQLVEDARRLVA